MQRREARERQHSIPLNRPLAALPPLRARAAGVLAALPWPLLRFAMQITITTHDDRIFTVDVSLEASGMIGAAWGPSSALLGLNKSSQT